MSVTFGFYNSLAGDRTYDAIQMSSIFDGIIKDGVFASIGTAFVVKATDSLTVNVGIGRAWFNHTWTLNDSILPMDAPVSEILQDRIDAVVLEVDASEAVRANSIKFVKGVPSTAPSRPTLINAGTVHQYPLCYITRPAGSTIITQAQIENRIGSVETPFITGILQTINLSELLGQWEAELDQFVAREEADFTAWMGKEKTEFTAWRDGEKTIYYAWFEALKADLLSEQTFLNEWVASEQADFLAWFNTMKGQLSTDAAGHLQNEIDREEVNRLLLVGFEDGSKVFSKDGTSIVSTASDGRKLTKTFTDSFLIMTNVLTSAAGAEVARMIKKFDSSGSLINTEVIYK